MKIVLVTGGFDPLHSGHIEYFKAAKLLGDILVVGINSDEWLTRKKGQPFMIWSERQKIIKELKMVDYTLQFFDEDDTAKHAISLVRKMWPSETIVFANGGDRTKNTIPEMDVEDNNLEFVFGVGGANKINSSSSILKKWKSPKTERPWGYYTVLHETLGMKVKELTVDPGKSLSMQKHLYRSEYWIVSEGKCEVSCESESGHISPTLILQKNDDIKIKTGEWHQLNNPYSEPCRIVEIQYGKFCDEKDIERK